MTMYKKTMREALEEVASFEIKEEVELDEKTKWKMGDGRPRGGSHIENERFWDLPKSSLEYIIKDAGEAMRLNPTARKATTGRGNWADQVNDAQTVLGWRRKNGIKEEVELDEWTISDVELAMKKKYGKVDKEAIEKLKKVQYKGNVDRNDLVKVGHGKLHVEEVELDEAKMSSKQIAALKKAYEPMRGGRLSMDNATKLGNLMDRFDKDKDLLIQLFKADIPRS